MSCSHYTPFIVGIQCISITQPVLYSLYCMHSLYFPLFPLIRYNRHSSLRLHVFQGAPRPGSLTPSEASDLDDGLPEVTSIVKNNGVVSEE